MKLEFTLDTPVQFLKSVGPARSRALSRLGIETVGHLLAHYPRRYFDRSSTTPVSRLKVGEEGTVAGDVLTASERRTHRGQWVQTVAIGDDTGIVFCVWFGQRFLMKQFRPGKKVLLSGRVQANGNKKQMAHPDFEIIENSGDGATGPGLNTGRIVPVYGLTSGIGQHWLRSLVDQALGKLSGKNLPETLPKEILQKRDLMPRVKALKAIHFPVLEKDVQESRRRLVYEELFFIQVLMVLRRGTRLRRSGISLAKPGDLTASLVRNLPFEPTAAQRRVSGEILKDLRSGQTMHRLLQGDVGSGKTLVALIAALFVVEQGHQVVIMAPTEVLARQHGLNLLHLCEPLGVTVETLTGSVKARDRRAILAGVAQGEIDILVGTHAVIQDDVRIPRLALAVIDEQHRFGVLQRGKSTLGDGQLEAAHMLVMSATPIPRSLSLTLYGDLDLSIIDQLPGGRLPIKTTLARGRDESKVYEACRREVAAGRQGFIVFPVIEESESQDVKAATVEFERLQHEVFPEMSLGLVHGRLKGTEKNEAMEAFSRGETQILVATTVVEVGVDVPNATFMVIHHPQKYGLAQLHQLRGRIGRGSQQSSCWLVCDDQMAEDSRTRIQFFATTSDGFLLAEEDLRMRGPGDMWGQRQHGLPGFKLANPLTDAAMVALCRDDATALLDKDPQLSTFSGRQLRRALQDGFEGIMPLQSG
jgi:ATP-dependent DNA helicase RecG